METILTTDQQAELLNYCIVKEEESKYLHGNKSQYEIYKGREYRKQNPSKYVEHPIFGICLRAKFEEYIKEKKLNDNSISNR